MSAHLSDEEQLEALKRWWAENGKSTVVGVVLAVGGYLGWEGWQQQQQQQAETASAAYQSLVESLPQTAATLSDQQYTSVNYLSQSIKDEHASSQYAAQSALLLAKLAVAKDDLQTAETQLQWVVDGQFDEGINLLAKSRLARVKLAQGEYDAALALVSGTANETYASLFAELRGDILLRTGDEAAALTAYQEAQRSLTGPQQSRGPLLKVKISDLQHATVASDVDDAAQDIDTIEAKSS